jgi:hypothetical protein
MTTIYLSLNPHIRRLWIVYSNNGHLAETPLADIALDFTRDGVDADDDEGMDAGKHAAKSTVPWASRPWRCLLLRGWIDER